MNQILDYNPNKSAGKGPSTKSDIIVRVFAVLLALFAIALLASGGYKLYTSKMEEKKIEEQENSSKADIVIKADENNQTVQISVTHDKVIKTVTYMWDSEMDKSKDGNGETTISFDIPLLQGDHKLTVIVTDIDGNETKKVENIQTESGVDAIPPTIDVQVTPEKKLLITAKDDVEMAYITYRWNEDEEVKIAVDDEQEDKTTIEYTIDIMKGVNSLRVIAVDASPKSNTGKFFETYTGVTKPDVKITIASDKKSANIYCSHEDGLKRIKLSLNGQDYDVDIGQGNPKEASFDIQLGEGQNTIKVTATTTEETETVAEETVDNTPENPEIVATIEQPADSGDKVTLTGKCQSGIAAVKLNVNDVDYTIDIGNSNPTDITFDFELLEGNNKITFVVVSVNGAEQQVVKEFTR